MPADDPHSHQASVQIAVPAEEAFAFLASGMNQTYWALGSWNRVDLGDGLFSGTSLWDASTLYIRPVGHPELLLVDYSVGTDPDDLRRVVEARVVPGATLDLDPGSCIVTFSVWRHPRWSEESWRRTYHAFKSEVHLIKGRLEHEFPEDMR